MATVETARPKIASRAEWLDARKELLAQEKQFTRKRDALSAARRELPWVRVDKEYTFDTRNGRRTLAELFDGRSQLIVYHFMLGPGWKEGCPGCSFLADHIDGPNLHLAHHDVTLMAVSHAPLSEIEVYKKRMGWSFDWASSYQSDFNYDYQVSFTKEDLAKGGIYYNYETNRESKYQTEELPGLSVFYKDDEGKVFHTYSTYARGLDILLGTYHFLDITPQGRNETGNGNLSDWIRRHDMYEHSSKPGCCGPQEKA